MPVLYPAQRRYQPAASVAQADPAQYDPTSGAPPPVAPNAGPLGGQGDTSWFNPYQPSVLQPNASIPASSVPYYGGSDIAKQFQNERNTQQNQGDMFQQYFGDQASQRFGNEQAAAAKSGQLEGQLEQTPGYTQQEIDAMLGNGPNGNAYQNLLNQDYNSNYLTQPEQDRIMGNPNDAPNTAYRQSAGYIQGTADQLNQNQQTTQSNLNDAIDRTALSPSEFYNNNLSNIETQTGNKVDTAAYNPSLTMSNEYARQAGMTDQEVADTAAEAGQSMGAQTRSAIQDLERQAAASGNESPLAVAAMRSQFEDQNAVNNADAVVNAELAARAQQRQAATGVENTRLNSEQYKTNAQIGAGEAMGQFAAQNEQQREAQRLAAEQDISNRKLGVASQVGQMGQQNAMYTGNANLQNESDYGNRAMTAENEAATRAAGVATNRQDVSQANQANQFNRGYQVNSTLSGINQNVAGARIGGQQELRNYYTGQQQYQGAQGNQANQNLLTNRQQTQQGTAQATQGSAAWELGNKNFGFGSNFARSFGSSLGNGLGKGLTGASGGGG